MRPVRRESVPKSPVLESHRSDGHFRRLLDKLPAAAYLCDEEGLITYFNHHAVAVWGRAPKLNDPVDRFCGSFRLFDAHGSRIPHDACWMALALQHNREYNGEEIVIEQPNGERLTVLAHANPIHDDDDRLIGAVNVLVDITTRKRAEEVLKEADRAKNEFLATLSHELRNPLAPIRNAVRVLHRKRTDEPEGRRALDVIERQMQQMTRLVDDLLDVSRITGNKLKLRIEQVTLSEVLEASIEISRPLIEEAGHTFDVCMPEEAVHLDGDIHRLAQAVSNLLNNAAKYTPSGGRLELKARRVGDEVVISVRDDGTGIQPELLTQIFDTFTQGDGSPGRSTGGLGIGLPLAKRVIEMHDGMIEARSEGPGMGSEFVVRLPARGAAVSDGAADLVRAKLVDPSGAPAKEIFSANNGHDGTSTSEMARQRVLVVDDNKDVVESTMLLLELMDIDVRSAASGREALDLAEDFRPHVVLLDIGMPDMDGLETAHAFRQRPWGRTARLIAVTGWGQKEDILRSKEAGFDDHVVKPMDPDALMDLLRPIDHDNAA